MRKDSISTFLDTGCQLLLPTDDGGIHVVGNGLYEAQINVAIILREEHYNIIYRRIFWNDMRYFKDLGEADPVNQHFYYSPVDSSGSPSSRSYDEEEDPTLGYADPPD